MKANHTARKILSMLLVIMMIITAVPFAFAAKTEAASGGTQSNGRSVVYMSLATANTHGLTTAAGGNATNDGLTDQTPVNSYTLALTKLKAAMDANPINNTEGIIVVCGRVSHSTVNINLGAGYKVIITSYIDGKDYRPATISGAAATSSAARWFVAEGSSTYYWQVNVSSLEIEYITFVGRKSGIEMFVLNNNNMKFGDGIDWLNVDGTTTGTSKPLYVIGGRNSPTTAATMTETQSIVINSGSYYYVRGGDRLGTESTPTVWADGSACNITINGGTFTYSIEGDTNLEVIAPVAQCIYQEGSTANLTINGGTFNNRIAGFGYQYYAAKNAAASYACDVNITINGGTFNSIISAVQNRITTNDYYTQPSGDFSLTINGNTAVLAAGKSINGESAHRTGAAVFNFDPYANPTAVADYRVTGFDTIDYNTDTTKAMTFTYPAAVTAWTGVNALTYSTNGIGDIKIASYVTPNDTDGNFTMPIKKSDTASTVELTTVVVDGLTTTTTKYPYSIAGNGTAITTASPVTHGTPDVAEETLTSEIKAIFVAYAGSDDNDGLTAETPKQTFIAAINALTAAIAADTNADQTKGTIVICGNIGYGGAYASLPETDIEITFTSNWKGVDYRLTGANFYIGDGRLSVLDFKFDTVFDCLNLVSRTAYQQLFVLSYHDFTVTANTVYTKEAGGLTAKEPIIILGNQNLVSETLEPATDPVTTVKSFNGTQNVEINGGTWYYVRGGDRGSYDTDTTAYTYTLVGSSAVINITINNGMFTATDKGLLQPAMGATGMCAYEAGSAVNFTVNGGTFAGNIYGFNSGCSRSADATLDATVTMEINGGSIAGDIIGVQNADTTSSVYHTPGDVTLAYNPYVIGGSVSEFTSTEYAAIAGTTEITFNYPDGFEAWNGAVSAQELTYSTYGTDKELVGLAIHDDIAGTFTLPIYDTDTDATVLLSTGECVCILTAYPYAISGTSTTTLSAGASSASVSHTYAIAAEYAGVNGATANFYGSKCSACGDIEYEYTIDTNGPVVFLKATGSISGIANSPETAQNSIVNSLNLLENYGKGGTLVVCGLLTPGPFSSPDVGGKLIITCVYDGHDYRNGSTTGDANDARVQFNGSAAPHTQFVNDVIFDDLDIASTSGQRRIFMNGNNLTITDSVRMMVATSGADEGDNASTAAPRYIIYGGQFVTDKTATTLDCTGQEINIAGGRWMAVALGNYRAGGASGTGTALNDGAGVKGDVTLNITGGYFYNNATGDGDKYDTLSLSKALDANGGLYNATANIYDGDFSNIANIYAKSRTGSKVGVEDNTVGTLTYNIYGGTFNADSGLTINSSTGESSTSSHNGNVIVNVYDPTEKILVDGTNKGTDGKVVLNNAAGNENLSATEAVSASVNLSAEGFAIRYDNNDTTKNGIRFSTNMPIAERDKTLAGANYEIVEYGILVKAANNTRALEWYDGTSAPASHGRIAKSMSFSNYGDANDSNIFRVYKKDNDNNNIGYIFSSVLVGINNENVTTGFTFRSYAVYNVGTADAPEYVVAYGMNEYTKSIAEVASEVAATDTYYTDYSAEAQAYINGLASQYIAP